MNYLQAQKYIDDYKWNLTSPGLSRICGLMKKLGNPQDRLKFVHVAGTNGKGSTCAMTESILRKSGLKTGLFSSPPILEYLERIQVNGENISEDAFAGIVTRVAKIADAMDDHPTSFEMLTAVGILYFVEAACDIVVMETGLGGRSDSTNVINTTECCVITRIGFDHMEFLGNTISQITLEKAGIIKPGAYTAIYENAPEVCGIIEKVCSEKNSRLFKASDVPLSLLHADIDGQRFSLSKESENEYYLPLLGSHQLENVRTAVAVVHALRKKGYDIDDDSLRAGLREVCWRARFEVLSKNPLFILDGGHNTQCAQSFAEGIREYASGKVTLLIGMLADKEYDKSIDILAPVVSSCVCITPDSPRALCAGKMKELFEKRNIRAVCADSIEEGVEMCLDIASREKTDAAAFGSLYSCGRIIRKAEELIGHGISNKCAK